jgi:hypothetical protein
MCGHKVEEILSIVLEWKKEKVRKILQDLSDRNNGKINVVLSIIELQQLNIDDLYKILIRRFDNSEIIYFFMHVFNNDPSILDDQSIDFGSLYLEKPFPRYFVSICYLLLLDCYKNDIIQLREAVWNNILTGKQVYWPELVVEILNKVYKVDELLDMATLLLGSNDEHENLIGENILYGIPKGKKEIRKKLNELIGNEKDEDRIRKYKSYLRKY